MAFVCSGCRVPIGRRYGYCSFCEREYLRLKRRQCCDCKAPMPRGRSPKRCRDCLRIYIRRLAQRPNRLCRCGSRIPRGYTRRMCPDCRSIEMMEYEARKRQRG